MLRKIVSPAMLEHPLLRDLNLNHKLELHCSSLHHIPDIVIFDLDMLQLVMEHWVLRQLHTTLVVAIYTSSIQLEIKQIR